LKLLMYLELCHLFGVEKYSQSVKYTGRKSGEQFVLQINSQFQLCGRDMNVIRFPYCKTVTWFFSGTAIGLKFSAESVKGGDKLLYLQREWK